MKRLPCFGDKFPVVALGVERKFQNAVGVRIADFASGQRRRERAMALATGTGHDFSDAVRNVGLAFGILRRETLVIVIVPVDYDSGSRFVQVLPERLHFWIVAVLRAGTE
jgi:hypothetical protein